MIGPSEARYVARVSPDEADQLRDLHRAAPRVHKSLSANHPRRQKSRQLSEMLTRLNRRGVPIEVMAEIIGISHQAVRSRVSQTEISYATFNQTDVLHKTLYDDSEGILITDAGMHRRLMRRNPIGWFAPFIDDYDLAIMWLESSSGVRLTDAPSASVLRTPTAVYFTHDLFRTVLKPLTSEADS